MKRGLVLFGAGDIAEIAHFYFTNDSAFEVRAFTVDREFVGETTFHGLPVVPFDELPAAFAPDDCDLFVAMSYAGLNSVRASKCDAAKQLGYHLPSYVSSRATIWPGFAPGENCFILEDNTIQPFVRIGRDVTLWSGNHIGHHSVIGDHCFVSSHVVVSGGVSIGDYSFIGVNATIRDHVRIGRNNVIGAGALILRDTGDFEVYTQAGAELSKVPSNRLRRI